MAGLPPLVCAALAAVAIMAPLRAEAGDVEAAAQSFVSTPSFLPIDIDQAKLADLLDMSLTDIGLARKDADLTAVEKSLLLLELNAVALPRARYVARLGVEVMGDIPVSFVEVERYNLGPAIRQEAIDSYGAESVAPLEQFGVGPHVAWRFAFQPNAKAAAILLAASRRDIPDDEAARRDCAGRPCLALDVVDEMAEWKEVPFELTLPKLPYGVMVAAGEQDEDANFEGQESSALAALKLAAAAGLASVDAKGVMWTAEPSQGFGRSNPFATWVIDRNLGQDVGLDAILGVAAMDKDTAPRWVRLQEGGGEDGLPPLLSAAEGALRSPAATEAGK